MSAVRNWPLAILDRAGLVAAPTYHLRNGSTFHCRGRSTDLAEIVVVGTGLEYPMHLLGPLADGALVLDIGANIGAFSVWLSRQNWTLDLVGWAIEPYPPNLHLLQTNLTENAVPFSVAQVAISDHDGTVAMDDTGDVDAVAVTSHGGTFSSPCVRLSTFCKDRRIESIDLLKIDIEGHEYSVLRAESAFLRSNVKVLALEWHRTNEGSRATLVDLLSRDFEMVDARFGSGGGILIMQNRHVRTFKETGSGTAKWRI